MRVAQKLYEGIDIGGETVASSPTCEPTACRWRRGDRLRAQPHRQRFRRPLPAGQAARLLDQGEERAGSPRGHPAHRRVAHAEKMRKYLPSDEFRLYELIWKRTMASQMESAELERTTVDILAKAGAARSSCAPPPGRALRRLPHALTPRTRTTTRRRTAAASRPCARATSDARAHRRHAAFHGAAAALHGSVTGEEDGGARHRPPLHLRPTLQVLRDREYVGWRRSASSPRTRAASSPRSSRASSRATSNSTSPRTSRTSSNRISNNEVEWKEVMRRFWEEFSAAIGGTKECAPPRCSTSWTNCSGRISSRRRRTAAMAAPARAAAAAAGPEALAHRPLHRCSNYPECRYTRPFGVPTPEGDGETPARSARTARACSARIPRPASP